MPRERGLTVVESVGGVRSPIAADGDTRRPRRCAATRTRASSSPTPASARSTPCASLSTALAPHRVVVFLNRFDPDDDVHVRNADWLRAREGFEVITDLDDARSPRCTARLR